MEKLVNIFLFGKKYEVPENLTIMTAMEYAGYQLVRGCGCLGCSCSIRHLQNLSDIDSIGIFYDVLV